MAELLSFTGTCEARLDSANEGNTIPLLSAPEILSPYWGTLEKDYILACDLRLESLRAEVNLLESLAPAPFPNIYPEDSTSVKLEKKFEIERSYPYLGLEILKRSKSGNILKLSEIPLQNKGNILHTELRVPYLGTGLVKLLGKDDEIFLKIRNHGYGGISSSNDYIQIEGDYSLILSGLKKTTDAAAIVVGGIPLIENGQIDRQFIPPENSLPIDLSVITALSFVDAKFFMFSGEWLISAVGNEDNSRIPFYTYIMETLNHSSVQFRSGITSLQTFNPIEVFGINLNGVNSLLDVEVSMLSRLTNLKKLILRQVSRGTVDFSDLILNTNIDDLDCYNCQIPTNKIDEIITACDLSGRENGYLDLRLNSPPSAGLIALNNIANKGWSFLID